MRFILLFLIQLYWRIIPEDKRRYCIFEESCSRFVYRITATRGLIKGLKALRGRFKQCRPGYVLSKNKSLNVFELHLKDGSTIRDKEISARIVEQFVPHKK